MAESKEVVQKNLIMFILFQFVVQLIAQSGQYLCYVGLLATFPLQFTMSIIAYRDCFGVQGARSFQPPPPVNPAAYGGPPGWGQAPSGPGTPPGAGGPMPPGAVPPGWSQGPSGPGTPPSSVPPGWPLGPSGAGTPPSRVSPDWPPSAVPPEPKLCESCRTPLPPGARFCPACGSPS
jgi:hypothetical protein